MKSNEISFFIFFLALVPSLHSLMPGEPQEIPVTDPEVVRLSQTALLKLDAVRGEKHSLVEIVRATKQIVSGILTKLTLKVNKGGFHDTCNFEIWEQAWLNKTKITHSCEKREPEIQEEKDLHLQLFNNYIKKFNKNYADDREFKKRFHIFRANLKKIQRLREEEKGTGQYGLTEFADLSAKEFQKYLGLKKPSNVKQLPQAKIPNINLPQEFDWRNYNAVTPVKNQKMCGSCWAFSVTGNVEGQWAIKRGQLLSLSEQELVDCDRLDNGCEGGYMTNAYDSIMKLGGLETEKEYPYDAKDEVCNFNKSDIAVTISGAVNISSDEVEMAKWLVKNGPMSVGLNAFAMQFYFGGVSHPPNFLCNPKKIDHGVLIVGFGVHHSTIQNKLLPFWLVKNSWGPSWGERGYYKLYRGKGTCGINQMVSSAIVN